MRSPRLIPRLDVQYGLEDFRLALGSSNASHSILDSTIERLWAGAGPVFVNSGRAALFLAFLSLGLGKGSHIGVPLYTCEAVFSAVAHSGATPIFLDVEPDTFTLSPVDLERKAAALDAVVPIHTFGHPTNMEAVLSLPKRVKVIEDCSHAIGSRYDGRTVGTFGDAAAFSFRLGKPISAGNLGMLLSSNPEVLRRASTFAAEFPARSIGGNFRDSLASITRGILYKPPWFGSLTLPIGSAFDGALDLMDKRSFRPARPSEGSLAVLAKRLREFPERVRIARERAAILTDRLRGTSIEPPVEASFAFHTYFQFAMRFKNRESRERGWARLRSHDVDSIRFYYDSPLIAERYGYRRDCPGAEVLSRTVLTVPCHAHLSADEFEGVANAMRAMG